MEHTWFLRHFTTFLILCVVAAGHERRCVSQYAYVTMATDDLEAVGTLVLRQSLINSQTKACIVVMVTNRVSWILRDILDSHFDHVESVQSVPIPRDIRPSQLFSKLYVWSFTNYTTVVFLHSDALVLKNVDELFDRPELSAVSESTWTDLFNSGVMVLQPNAKTLKKLLKLAKKGETYDESDQGVLNLHFTNWEHLPYIYNTAGDAPETAMTAYNRFGHKIKVVRFQSDMKPWFVSYNMQDQQTEMHAGELGLIAVPRPLFEKWWQVFLKSVRPLLDKALKRHNMEIVVEGPRIYLGDPYSGLHVQTGFFTFNDRSYPKFINVKGVLINNQYCDVLDMILHPTTDINVQG